MSGYEAILWEVRDGVARVTINRPEQRNALNPQVQSELLDAFTRARSEDDVHVVVLTGAGDKAFCAGGDLGGIDPDSSPVSRHFARTTFTDLLRAMAGAGKPVLGAVNGHALAGGMGLAMACDIVVAVEDARFGLPEVDIGLWPMMITPVLVRALGPRKALELMLTGDRVDAAEAHRLGAVTRVVPRESFDATVDELASKLASRSPVVVKLGRDAFYAAQDMTFDASLHFLHSQFSVLLQCEDVAEGVTAWFQKRPPEWKGR
ncbi:MAG TPA: enoyl-CoA hydratase-related protein [Actinomycetota bacterium]|nr:enoyl-CoA hydratase-related protein [Actinomycetota bacterium]